MNIFTRTNDDDLLKYMSDDEIKSFHVVQDTLVFQPGDYITRSGERDRDMYVILKGTAGIYLSNYPDKVFLELTERNLIGEINFILPTRRSASVRAITELKVIRYDYKRTVAFLAEHITIAAKFFAALNDILGKKLIKTSQKQASWDAEDEQDQS